MAWDISLTSIADAELVWNQLTPSQREYMADNGQLKVQLKAAKIFPYAEVFINRDGRTGHCIRLMPRQNVLSEPRAFLGMLLWLQTHQNVWSKVVNQDGLTSHRYQL